MPGSELDDGTSDELRVIPHRHVANPREHVNLGGGHGGGQAVSVSPTREHEVFRWK